MIGSSTPVAAPVLLLLWTFPVAFREVILTIPYRLLRGCSLVAARTSAPARPTSSGLVLGRTLASLLAQQSPLSICLAIGDAASTPQAQQVRSVLLSFETVRVRCARRSRPHRRSRQYRQVG